MEKILEKSGNFVSPEKWEPCKTMVQLEVSALPVGCVRIWLFNVCRERLTTSRNIVVKKAIRNRKPVHNKVMEANYQGTIKTNSQMKERKNIRYVSLSNGM